MSENCTQVTGIVRIAPDVLATIAAAAAQETEGVAGLTGPGRGFLSQPKLREPGRIRVGHAPKGVSIAVDSTGCTVNIAITVKPGARLHKVSAAVQENVTSAISSMTGLDVPKVNINVSALSETLPA